MSELKDFGPAPLVTNIEDNTEDNDNFRTALWTGKYLQVTLMSIPVGGDIGLEIHPDTDQFIRMEAGRGRVEISKNPNERDGEYDQAEIKDDHAVVIPAGYWHNITNIGDKPMKVYSIYAPPHHPHGTVHATQADAEAAEEAEE